MTDWTKEICSSQPEVLQIVAPKTYIERRNIEKVEHPATGDETAYTDYECESRFITESEKALLESIEEIETDKAIDEYTLQLIEEGII